MQKLRDLEKIQTEIPNQRCASEDYSTFLENLYGLAKASQVVYEEEVNFSGIFKTEDLDERIRFLQNSGALYIYNNIFNFQEGNSCVGYAQ